MIPARADKDEITRRILDLGIQVPCTKLAIDNIIFPAWDKKGLFGLMIRQYVRTKEFPDGFLYDETQFQLVLRVLEGKLLMNDRPDCYCWKKEKVSKEESKGNVKPIGIHSFEGFENASRVSNTIIDEGEKRLFIEELISRNEDLMLIHLDDEERICIVVTQEMIDAGITYCVNSYQDVDPDGLCKTTPLYVGDILIVEPTNLVYRVGREEADITYRLHT